MKNKILAVLIVCFAAQAVAYAASTPNIESKGTFVKITASDRQVPTILYIKRSSILSISIESQNKDGSFYVEIVTSPFSAWSSSGDHGMTAASVSKSYLYRFTDEPSASAFCESLVSDQKG